MTHEPNEPKWLKLAAALRAEPDPATSAHVRARLARRAASEPSWVRWLARPIGLALSAGLLVVSAVTSVTWVATHTSRVASEENDVLTSVFVGDESMYGLPIGTTSDASVAPVAPADSQEAVR